MNLRRTATALATRPRAGAPTATAIAIAATLICPNPTASADPDPWDAATKGAVCALTTTAFTAVAATLTRGRSGSKWLMAAAGGGAGGACPIVFDRWARGLQGNLDVTSPKGLTVSQQLYQSQLAAGLPMDPRSIDRRAQCAGWLPVSSAYYNMCLDYDLDPLYR